LAEAETDSLGGKVYTRSKNGNNLAENDLTGLALDSQVNREIYAMLLKRLETARITKELDNFKEGTSFTIIESPRLPLKHVKPNKIIFLLGGIFCGVVVGYTCVYIIEMLDTSYQSLNEAKADLQPVPVLGSISAIITEREFNRRQQGARFTYAAMGIIFIIIVAFVLLFSLFN